MTFLKYSPSVVSMKISNLHEKSMLKQFPFLLNYEDINEKLLKAKKNGETQIFDDLLSAFIYLIEKPLPNIIYSLDGYLNNNERTVYKAKNKETIDLFNQLIPVLFYLQFASEQKYPFFSEINVDNDNFLKLAQNGFNIRNEKDMKELMSHFWNIEIPFRIFVEK